MRITGILDPAGALGGLWHGFENWIAANSDRKRKMREPSKRRALSFLTQIV
ncbi:hypothetical protein ACFLYR_00150 [Chloroflexota bacterium]